MDDLAQRKAAQAFADEWKDRGSEKRDCQSFWLSLLRDVCGAEHPEALISFEKRVRVDKKLSRFFQLRSGTHGKIKRY